MDSPYYEIYVQPTDGPCSVHERGFNNEISWTEQEPAVETAKAKRRLYHNIHFLVHKVTGRQRELVYQTMKDPEFTGD